MAPFPDYPVERACLIAARDTLLPDHEGRFVVIIGVDVIGIEDTLDEALDLGFRRAGGPGFFATRITDQPELTVMPAAILSAI